MPEATIDTHAANGAADTGNAGAEPDDSFIDSILAADGFSLDSDQKEPPEPAASKETEASPEPPAQAETPAEPDATPAEPPDNAALAALATELGLDPTNARDKAALEKMLAKLASSETQPAKVEAPEELTEFEKSLLEQKPEAPASAAPETRPPEQKTNGAVQPSIDADWRSPEDAYKALTAAYGDGETPADYRRVAEIENAMFSRRAQAVIMPAIEEMFHSLLDKRFGGILPQLQQEQKRARSNANYDFAIEQIGKTKGYEDFGKLYDKLDDKKLTIGTNKNLPNLPINQVYAKYPHLLDIRVQHPDEDMAEKLSNIKRLRAVHKHWQEMNASAKAIPAEKAKDLINAGAQQEQRKAQDRTRQSLNAGTGVTGAGAGNKDADENWFKEMSRSASGISLSDLLKG